MFSQDDLQELLAFDAGNGRILSLYLATDTTEQTLETIKLQLRGMLKESATDYADDVEAIEKYFGYTYDWSKPGIAVFSCAEKEFFRAYPVAISFRNRLRISRRPFVKPLIHLLDHYAHYGVILVDSVGARFFRFHLGELQATAGFMGEDVRKLKHGGGSSVMGMRGGQAVKAEDEQALRNMRDTAAEAARFFGKSGIRRLFLGGTASNVAQFQQELPKQLLSCLAGSFPMDMDAGENEVRDRSLALLREINAEREQKLVADMLSMAARGGTAVTGLAATLRMISDGRVDTLVISDGYRSQGYQDPNSGYLAASADDELFGDNVFSPVEDVVEAAAWRTLEQRGSVEFISENPDLDASGRIGALLRY